MVVGSCRCSVRCSCNGTCSCSCSCICSVVVVYLISTAMKSMFSEGPARVGTDYRFYGYGTVGTVGTVGARPCTDRTVPTVPTVPYHLTHYAVPLHRTLPQSITLEIA